MLQVHEVEVSRLRPWEDNPRLNDQAVSAVAQSIHTFGFNVPILCDQHLMIIAGHTRWKAARQLDLNTVPVIMLEMTDAQRRAFSVADNKTAELADWDLSKLRAVLDELHSEDFDLHSLGFSDLDLKRMLFGRGVNEDELPETPRVASTERGQLFALDAHRLICGNSCEEATWRVLLEGQLIDLVISSPPRFNNLGMGSWACYDDFCVDMQSAVGCLSERLAQSGVVFWTAGNSGSISSNLAGLYARLFESAGLEYLDTVAWVRPGANFTSKRVSHIRRNSLYLPAHQWEPILVYKKSGRMSAMVPEGKAYMLSFQTDVWEIAAVNVSGQRCDHPAVAPVEVPYRALQAYSKQGDVVVDPFAGSGTTLIAVERAGLGTKAYLAEINPVFCDMIIDRWERYTGKRAELLDERSDVK